MKNIVTSWVVCVLALVALFAWLGRDFGPDMARDDGVATNLIRGKFSLTDAAGKTVTERDFRGRYMLVYFGFTHCPDICPTSLLLMQNALRKLGDKANNVQPIFITLDPERDSPKITGDYARHFGSTIGLSGTPEQIAAAAENFKVYYSKSEDKSSALGYMVDHSGFIYLMGRDGNYITHFAHTAGEREIEEGLKKHVR